MTNPEYVLRDYTKRGRGDSSSLQEPERGFMNPLINNLHAPCI